jgi:hypothetical protein
MFAKYLPRILNCTESSLGPLRTISADGMRRVARSELGPETPLLAPGGEHGGLQGWSRMAPGEAGAVLLGADALVPQDRVPAVGMEYGRQIQGVLDVELTA